MRLSTPSRTVAQPAAVVRARTVVPRASRAGRSPRRARRVLAVLAALVAISAYGGAIGLAGGGLSIGSDLEARLPWGSPVLGGIALAMLVGMPFTVLAGAAWRGTRRTNETAMGAGALLVGWIAVELAFIRELSIFHPLYAAIGIAFVLAGRYQRRLRA